MFNSKKQNRRNRGAVRNHMDEVIIQGVACLILSAPILALVAAIVLHSF